MVEPISAGTLATGGRMIWEGIKWMVRSRQAPWSVVNMSATMAPHILPWYSVRFFSVSEKPIAIDLLSARTIRNGGGDRRQSAQKLAMVDPREGRDEHAISTQSFRKSRRLEG
jgi:hypothetical protein